MNSSLSISKKFYQLLCFIFLLGLAQASLADKKLAKREIKIGNQERNYYIRYPQTLESQTRFPLLIVLHGGGRGNGDEVAKYTGFADMADQEKYIAVFPNADGKQWKDGRVPKRKQEKYLEGVENDIQFIKELIDYLIKFEQVDSNRVYITGLSNGGMMTMRMLCEASEKFAAAAPIIANMPVDIIDQCNPKRAVPMVLMNGTEDPLIPWQGGEIEAFFKDRGKVISSEKTFDFWLNQNDCDKQPVNKQTLANKNTNDQSVITRKDYQCKNNVEMTFFVVNGGGHSFPGSKIPDRPRLLGQKNMDANGAELIWDFLSSKIRQAEN